MSYDVTNPAKPTIDKDPNAVLDYGWDLSNLIDNGDVIQAVDFVVNPVGSPPVAGTLVVSLKAIVGQTCYCFLSGGTPGTTESVTCRWTTAEGRTDDRTLFFKIKER